MRPQPIEHRPDRFRGELAGQSHPTAPVYLVWAQVEWDDGTLTDVPAWTHQWTRTHVYVILEKAPPNKDGYRQHPDPEIVKLWVRAGQVRRREGQDAQS